MGIRFTRTGLLKKLLFIAMVMNRVMNYANIKPIGRVGKGFLEEIYGKYLHCGHKMPEVGKSCSIYLRWTFEVF